MDVYDIVICGGSLAGSALAIRLSQHGFHPLIVEKRGFPRKKFRGDFLGPDSFESLQLLGALETILSKSYGPIEKAIFYSIEGKPLTVDIGWINIRHPYGIGVYNGSLDWTLLEYAKSRGVTVLENSKVLSPLSHQYGLFKLNISPADKADKEESYPVKAAIFVDASGQNSRLYLSNDATSEKDGTLPQKDEKAARKKGEIGIRANVLLTEPDDEKTLKMFFFPGGYGGIQPLSPKVRNICILASADLAGLMHRPFSEFVAETIGKNPQLDFLLKDCQLSEAIQTVSNLSFNSYRPYATGLLRVGDAMVAPEPFTGSGMSMALESGILAADLIAEGIHNRWDYWRIMHEYISRYQTMFGTKLNLLRWFRPMLFSRDLQNMAFPLIRPFLPLLAKIFR